MRARCVKPRLWIRYHASQYERPALARSSGTLRARGGRLETTATGVMGQLARELVHDPLVSVGSLARS